LSKKIVALLVMGLIAGAVYVPAAEAAPFVGVAQCTASDFEFPTDAGAVDCVGSLLGATGVDAGGPSAKALAPWVAHANYNEPCNDLGEPPLVGFADGTIEVDGDPAGTFSWTRVGVVAILNPLEGDAAAVAAFVPIFGTTVPNCSQSQLIDAEIVGLGALGL